MLCATTRRVPAACIAASRLSVPSVRMRALRRPTSRICSASSGRSVSWCITRSGAASTTTSTSRSRSYTSHTTGVAPSAARPSTFSAERVMPTTS
jgi:hypothetical protein